MNADLLAFLDAMDEKDYDRMFVALARLSESAGQKEIDDLFLVLDMTPVSGDIPEQLAAIRRQLTLLRKYSGERLR